MEGVMMRNGSKYAVAVRTVDKEIVVKTDEYHSIMKNEKILKLPIIRGVFNFIDSLFLGMKTLMYSADFFAEETPEEMEERLAKEEKKARKKAEKLRAQGKEKEADEAILKAQNQAKADRERLEKRSGADTPVEEKKESSGFMMGFTVAFSLVISIALFMMLPYFLSRALRLVTDSEMLISICEAVLRLAIFLTYIVLISRMKEIQRTFMYHGAEHKCINCIEHGLELNVENVRKSSKEHKRCGTSFLLIVMLVSIVFFLFIRVESPFWRVFIRLMLLPVIAGVSFEFIRLAGRYDNLLVNLLSKPGLCLQALTTKEPDDSMIEVGIASVEAVFDWRAYLNDNFGAHYDLNKTPENGTPSP